MARTKIQSILFNRKYFGTYSALQWLVSHGYKHNKIDKTDHYLRFRQHDPKPNKRYRIITFSPTIKAVIEY